MRIPRMQINPFFLFALRIREHKSGVSCKTFSCMCHALRCHPNSPEDRKENYVYIGLGQMESGNKGWPPSWQSEFWPKFGIRNWDKTARTKVQLSSGRGLQPLPSLSISKGATVLLIYIMKIKPSNINWVTMHINSFKLVVFNPLVVNFRFQIEATHLAAKSILFGWSNKLVGLQSLHMASVSQS